MSSKRMDPRKQFSKKLAARTEWFWFFYMVLMVALLAFRPEIGVISVYLSLIATIVMVVSVLAYTKNSLYEKGLWAANDMAKLKFKWKHQGTEIVTADSIVEVEEPDGEPEDEPEKEDGESNG